MSVGALTLGLGAIVGLEAVCLAGPQAKISEATDTKVRRMNQWPFPTIGRNSRADAAADINLDILICLVHSEVAGSLAGGISNPPAGSAPYAGQIRVPRLGECGAWTRLATTR